MTIHDPNDIGRDSGRIASAGPRVITQPTKTWATPTVVTPETDYYFAYSFARTREGYAPHVQAYQFLAYGYLNEQSYEDDHASGGAGGWIPPGLARPGGPFPGQGQGPNNLPPPFAGFDPGPPPGDGDGDGDEDGPGRPYVELAFVPTPAADDLSVSQYFGANDFRDPATARPAENKIIIASGAGFRFQYAARESYRYGCGMDVPRLEGGAAGDFMTIALWVRTAFRNPAPFTFHLVPRLVRVWDKEFTYRGQKS